MDKLMEANESKTRDMCNKEPSGGVSRTAQWVKALPAKPGNLNSVSETHMIEELQQVVS